MIMRCPKCGSKQVLTTQVYRWCRRCGHKSTDMENFESVDVDAKLKQLFKTKEGK